MNEYEVRFNGSDELIKVKDIAPEFAITSAMYRKGLTDVASVIVYKNAAIVLQCGRCILQGGHLSING